LLTSLLNLFLLLTSLNFKSLSRPTWPRTTTSLPSFNLVPLCVVPSSSSSSCHYIWLMSPRHTHWHSHDIRQTRTHTGRGGRTHYIDQTVASVVFVCAAGDSLRKKRSCCRRHEWQKGGFLFPSEQPARWRAKGRLL
jgi:hypothetical protein